MVLRKEDSTAEIKSLKMLRVVSGAMAFLCTASSAVCFGIGAPFLGFINMLGAGVSALHVRALTTAIRFEEAASEWKSDFTRAIEEAEAEADRAKVTPFRKKDK